MLAIERLAQITTPAAADALAGVLTATQDRMRAEAAANALGAPPRGDARARARAARGARRERAALLARLLRPRLRALAEGSRGGEEAGEGAARERAGAHRRRPGGGRAAAARARDRSQRGRRRHARAGRQAAEAQGRRRRADGAAARRARRRRHARRRLRAGGRRAARRAARRGAGDRRSSSSTAASISRRALRKDRQVSPEQRYQLGFVLVERRQPAGEEILADLAGAGRNKTREDGQGEIEVYRDVAPATSREELGRAEPSCARSACPAPPPPPRACRSGSARRPAQRLVAGRIDDVGRSRSMAITVAPVSPRRSICFSVRPDRGRAGVLQPHGGRVPRPGSSVHAPARAPPRRRVGRALGGQRLDDDLRAGAHVALQVGGAAPEGDASSASPAA